MFFAQQSDRDRDKGELETTCFVANGQVHNDIVFAI